MDSLLKAREVAVFLNLRPSTVYDLAHRGVLPHIIIRKGARRSLIRFRKEDLARFLQQRSIETSAPQDAA